MTQGRLLTAAEFLPVVLDFTVSAFRLELQDSYAEPEEDDLYAAFLAGSPPPATSVPELHDWYDAVAGHVRAGRPVERVRVQRDPPTPYQRFERWLDRWNIPAGEVMRYLSVARAHEIGLLPDAAGTDWWLLDEARLVVMYFDDRGRRVSNELITDPEMVTKACAWRDLAVSHSTKAELENAA